MRHLALPTILIVSTLLGLSACGGSSDSADADDSTGSAIVETPTASGLKINEIVASAQDDGNDWFELYAITDIADLSIYSVVDDDTDHQAQNLPEIALSAGSFLVIQAIDEADAVDGEYYVNFKLGGDDALSLFENGSQIDIIDWEEGDAPEGYSYGRYIDGTGSTQTMLPSPGEANSELTEAIVVVDKTVNNDAPLRINEIVAKDADGGEDWIELYVSGDDLIYLGDYSVSDEDDERVALPDITLAPGEFYRIYATDEELDSAATVDFKLGSSDQVNLYLDDDLIDQLSWDKGEALIGYSFGRYPDGSDAIATLIPSPQASNVNTAHSALVINEVVASHVDDGNDWFELYNNSSAEITLSDYSIIDSSSDIDAVTLPSVTLNAGEYIVIYAVDEYPGSYYVPFKLGKEDELSLIFDDETVDFVEWQESDVAAGYSYGLIQDGTWAKNTLTPTPNASNQLPEIYAKDTVESVYFEIDENQWQDLLDNALDEEYYLASMTYKGVTLDEVGIRTKGNSSLQSVYSSGGERFSFNIDINEYVSGQKLLGMEKFVLNNMFNDPSYMREFIAYDLMEEMGVATPEHAYVNVYVNDELKGLYLLVEFVNEEFINKRFSNTQGDLYKPDGTGSDLVWIDDNFSSYSGVELKTNEDSSDNGAFMNFVYQMAFDDAMSVIDYDSVLRYLAVSVALSNLDSYHGSLAHNYYIYEQDNVFSMLPWDLNESFGTFSQGCNGVDIRGLYIDEPTDSTLADKPLIALLLADAEKLALYHSYIQALIDGPLASSNFATRVSVIDALIAEHVAADPTAFYTYSQFKSNQTSNVGRFYGLTSFIDYRVNNMSQQLSGAIASKGTGSGYCRN